VEGAERVELMEVLAERAELTGVTPNRLKTVSLSHISLNVFKIRTGC
jgi:hypothetical protein